MHLRKTLTEIKISEQIIKIRDLNGKYQKFIAKGQMPKAVLETWQNIWKKDKELNRKYTADFEVYGENSQNGENSEVEIYIATE